MPNIRGIEEVNAKTIPEGWTGTIVLDATSNEMILKFHRMFLDQECLGTIIIDNGMQLMPVVGGAPMAVQSGARTVTVSGTDKKTQAILHWLGLSYQITMIMPVQGSEEIRLR